MASRRQLSDMIVVWVAASNISRLAPEVTVYSPVNTVHELRVG